MSTTGITARLEDFTPSPRREGNARQKVVNFPRVIIRLRGYLAASSFSAGYSLPSRHDQYPRARSESALHDVACIRCSGYIYPVVERCGKMVVDRSD